MKEAVITVSGEGVEVLPDLIKAEMPDATVRNEGSIVILFSEKYYLRINSSVMAVILCHPTKDGKCCVRVVSGGGTAGLLGLTWGSESHAKDRAVRLITSLCRGRQWEVKVS